MNRRTFLTGTALTVSSVLAGCIEETVTTDGTRPDPGDISVDGRLHNEMVDTHVFEVTRRPTMGMTSSMTLLRSLVAGLSESRGLEFQEPPRCLL